jgi:hypothetical protein
VLLNLIPPQIKIGLAIAAVVIIGIMGWRLHAAVEKNGRLSAELATAEQQVRTMAAQMNQRQKEAELDRQADAAALAESRRLAEQRRQQAATLASQLTEARANADLSACLDMRLPDSVRLP